MKETERERQRHRQREGQALYGLPDVGLDPRIPGLQPEPKANAQPLSHPGVLDSIKLKLGLYTRSLEFIHLITECLYPVINISPFPSGLPRFW